MSPLVSILIPVYNCADRLSDCLDSVLRQTYTNTEVLLYDDGSEDESAEIYQRYICNDERVKLAGQTKVGVAEARNTLLQAATGYTCVFVDSDDWVEPNFVETLLHHLVDDNLDFCGCSMSYDFDDISRPLFALNDCEYAVYNMEDAIRQYVRLTPLHGSLCNKMFVTKLVQNHKFNSGWSYAEDSDFMWNVLGSVNQIGLTKDLLYHYRYKQDSLSSRRYSRSQLNFIYSWNKILTRVKTKYPHLYEIAQRSYLHINLSLLYQILTTGHTREFQEDVNLIAGNIANLSIPFGSLLGMSYKYLLFYIGVKHTPKMIKTLFRLSRYAKG